MISLCRCLLRSNRTASKYELIQNKFTSIYSNLFDLHCRGYKYEYDRLIPKFPMNNPARTSTVILENYYVQVANYFKNPSYKLAKKFSKTESGLWSCSISVQWPFQCEFRADESKKTEAARVASLRTIEWLKSLEKIDDVGRPRLVEELNASVNLSFSQNAVETLQNLIYKYENEVKPIYEEYDRLHSNDSQNYFEETGIPSYVGMSEELLFQRNKALSNKLNESPLKKPLPIDELSEEILDIIENNRVVVIKGATGSGKSTRVPQLLLDRYIRQNRGTDCNVIVTEPRRISATSLAVRVASERNENLGFSVGHHVRFSAFYPTESGTIMFLSAGVFLQRLRGDPHLIGISHVIIDEAHERGINVDLTLLLMKELLEKHENIKVIIMSATINAEFFQQYFNNCPLLCVPGQMFDVKTYFIDDEFMGQQFRSQFYECDERDVDDNLIVEIVNWIHKNKPQGAVLVFLPGWSDIAKIQELLLRNENMTVLPAHSKLKVEQQQFIFEFPPPGKRKVILATNIAESSITIPDVVYVVDTGIVREIGLYNGVGGLRNMWISKAVAEQRRGRAGRVKEGECYRLYSKRRFESFVEYPVPEVMRTPLETLVMKIKTYRDEKPWDSLMKFPESPPENRVENAVSYLQQINVLDSEENLTALGRRIAMFGMHPLLSASLIYSVFFKCIDPMLFITSYLNGDAVLFGIDMTSSRRRNALAISHPTNDCLAAYNIYKAWRDNTVMPFLSSEDASVSMKSVETFLRISRLNMDYLFKARLIGPQEIFKQEEGTLANDAELSLTAPILLSATGKLAVNDKPYLPNGKVNHYLTTLDGSKVQIASESVNFKSALSSPFLTFYKMNTIEGFLRVYDTAVMSPLAVILFNPQLPQVFYTRVPDTLMVTYPNIELKMTAKREDVEMIFYFREMIWNSLNFFIRYYDSCIEEAPSVGEFRNELRSTLIQLLKHTNS